ncbi:MAG: Uma2 family endonuclease [Kamptonema sp. SIO4C4]|nr:Uma2 family endonuclease [Kamptonema sp. SIO4C4]
MNPIINPIRWTIHDLDALPKNEGIRREIIDGELFVTRAPHWKHQNIINKIGRKLEEWSEKHFGFVIPSPGIIPSKEDSVIPDLVWVSNERLAAIEDEAGHFTSFPELVMEVLSAGERNIYRDKQAKLKLYSQGEVQEYWIVDRFRQELEVYRQQKGQLVLVETLTATDTLTSPLFPNFSLSVSQIFA